MDIDEFRKKDDEPATLNGPAAYEEELKDYSKTGEENLIDNMPDSHPEPAPTARMGDN